MHFFVINMGMHMKETQNFSTVNENSNDNDIATYY